MLKNGVDVREATHVQDRDGHVEKIAKKFGIGPNGELAKPSEGGFSVTTVTGRHIGMFEARSYLKEER